MRRPDDVCAERHADFLRWADWERRGCFVGLGYPSRSQIQVAREGGFAGGGVPAGVVASDAVAERVNAAFLKLAFERPEFAAVFRGYYVHGQSLRVQADAVGAPRTTVQAAFKAAVMWLEGALSRGSRAA